MRPSTPDAAHARPRAGPVTPLTGDPRPPRGGPAEEVAPMPQSAPHTSGGRRRPRIAHFAGANATIMNSPPLVTSNKARERHGLPLLRHPDGTPVRFDVLRAQRLAAPVTVYVEQFSAHPLERDAAELYA